MLPKASYALLSALPALLLACGGVSSDGVPGGQTDQESMEGSGAGDGAADPATGDDDSTVADDTTAGDSSDSVGWGDDPHSDDNAGPQNLLEDPSFEAGVAGWSALGHSTVIHWEDDAHTGSGCLATSERVDTWNGPVLDISELVAPDGQYEMRAWVRTAGTPHSPNALSLSLRAQCEGEQPTYTPFATASVASEWTELHGEFSADACALSVYLEGAPPELDVFMDDVALYAMD